MKLYQVYVCCPKQMGKFLDSFCYLLDVAKLQDVKSNNLTDVMKLMRNLASLAIQQKEKKTTEKVCPLNVITSL